MIYPSEWNYWSNQERIDYAMELLTYAFKDAKFRDDKGSPVPGGWEWVVEWEVEPVIQTRDCANFDLDTTGKVRVGCRRRGSIFSDYHWSTSSPANARSLTRGEKHVTHKITLRESE